jgi:NADH:ubiquinone reductase (H+-translocating)
VKVVPNAMKRTHVVILGGGFGGVYTALEFERRRDPDFEVTMVSVDNFFLFTPMLHEVAASDLHLTHIVNPMRKILRHVNFINAEVQNIDLANRTITISPRL